MRTRGVPPPQPPPQAGGGRKKGRVCHAPRQAEWDKRESEEGAACVSVLLAERRKTSSARASPVRRKKKDKPRGALPLPPLRGGLGVGVDRQAPISQQAAFRIVRRARRAPARPDRHLRRRSRSTVQRWNPRGGENGRCLFELDAAIATSGRSPMRRSTSTSSGCPAAQTASISSVVRKIGPSVT